MLGLSVIPNYLDDPNKELELAKKASFERITQDETYVFEGFSILEQSDAGIVAYRKYLPHFHYPTFIHNDDRLCKRTRVLFLMDDPAQSIRFWEPKTNQPNSFRCDDWNLVCEVMGRFNTCVEFNAESWHSRWPYAFCDYNEMRLIKVWFLK